MLRPGRCRHRQSTGSFDRTTRTLTQTSPGRRQLTATLDERGRFVREALGDLSPATYAYDSRGRLTAMTRGDGGEARVASVGYANAGYLGTITDPLQRAPRLAHGAAGRVIGQ